MAQEIEIKILEIDRNAVEKTLEKHPAVLHFSGEMLAIFYDKSDNSLKQSGTILRLRKEGETTVLTLKQKTDTLSDAKIMEETEVTVSNNDAIQHILATLGFEKRQITRKIRQEYLLNGNIKIVLDQYLDNLAYIPLFMEIEAPDLAALYDTVSLLGYTKSDCKNWTTYELTRYYEGKAL